jgi:hypothetical protein
VELRCRCSVHVEGFVVANVENPMRLGDHRLATREVGARLRVDCADARAWRGRMS